MYRHYIAASDEIETLLQPETELESLLLIQPELRRGLLWGKPRRGHPEGKVLYHVREVLDNVDRFATHDMERLQLRLMAIIHDAFKYREVFGQPRDWTRHHAVLARKFSEKWFSNTDLLNIIEWHDDAYYTWRAAQAGRLPMRRSHEVHHLLKRLEDDLLLYYQFFVCDTLTGDKVLAPLAWFSAVVERELDTQAWDAPSVVRTLSLVTR